MALKKATTTAPKKAATNATPAKPAPETKVETPAQAQEPKPTTEPAQAAANAGTGGTGLEPDTTSQGQADMQGKDTSTAQSTDETTAAQGIAATGATPGPADEDLQALKDEAYREGYSAGFSAALDEIAEDRPTPGADAPEGYAEQDPNAGMQTSPGYDRTVLIALALFTPENQRKGGIGVVVDRLQSFIEGLDPDDRWPALQFMHTIAQTKPLDLATGRFTMVITESLKALNGADPLHGETAADRGEAAAARFAEAFQQEDETERARDEDELPPADLSDADSGAAAAARLAGA